MMPQNAARRGSRLLTRGERALKNYIVRIYHAGKDIRNNFVGVVEEVGIEGRKSFASFDELQEILTSGRPEKPRISRRAKGLRSAGGRS